MVYDYSNFNSDSEKNSIGDDKVSIFGINDMLRIQTNS